jgi:hypothetical protein
MRGQAGPVPEYPHRLCSRNGALLEMSSKSTLRSGPKSIYGFAAEKPVLQNPRAFRFSFTSIADVDLMRMPARSRVITTGLVAVAVSVRVVRIVVGPVAVAADAAAEMGVQSAVSATDPTNVAPVTEAADMSTTEATTNTTADLPTTQTTPHTAAAADVPTAHTATHMAAPATVAAASTAASGKCICRSEASSQRHRQDGDQGHPRQTFVHVNSI